VVSTLQLGLGADLGDRRPHDAPPRLRDQPAEAQSNRGAVRLGQDDRRARSADAAWRRALEIQVYLHKGSLRPHTAAEVTRGVRMISATLSKWNRHTTRPAYRASDSPMLLPALPRAGSFLPLPVLDWDKRSLRLSRNPTCKCCWTRSTVVSLKAPCVSRGPDPTSPCPPPKARDWSLRER
jgi:hypothetical protein